MKPMLTIVGKNFCAYLSIFLLLGSTQANCVTEESNAEDTVVKLCYLGIQDKTVTSLLFSVTDRKGLASKFAAHNVLYQNDKALMIPLLTSAEEQENIIAVVKRLKNNSEAAELSIVIFDTKKNTAEEYRITRTQATKFYSEILAIIKSNRKIREAYSNWGNITRFKTNPANPPANPQ